MQVVQHTLGPALSVHGHPSPHPIPLPGFAVARRPQQAPLIAMGDAGRGQGMFFHIFLKIQLKFKFKFKLKFKNFVPSFYRCWFLSI